MDRSGDLHTLRFEMSFPPNASEHPGWPIVEYSITSGAKIVKQEDIELVVMLIPRKLRVMAGVTDFHEIELPGQGEPTIVKHRLPEGWDRSPEERLATHLQQLCGQLDVAFVDTTPELTERAAAGDLVYQSMDTHLSPLGHEIVSKMLAQAIEGLGEQSQDSQGPVDLQSTQ